MPSVGAVFAVVSSIFFSLNKYDALIAFLKVICELANTSVTECAISEITESDVMTQIEDSTHDGEGSSSLVQSCDDTTHYDKDCSECHMKRRDPTPSELTMCLHALSYKVST